MSPIVVFHAVHRENAPTRRVFKIEILKISGSALVAEICTDPHNRLLRRQHCSSLCSQSELQCFAPGLRQKSARCPLQRCHTRYAICSQNRTDIFLDFEHPTQRGLNALPSSRASPPFQAPNIPALFCFYHRHVLPETQFANPSSIPVSEPRPRHRRITSQMRTYHVPDAGVSRPRCGRVSSQTR